MPQDLPPPLLRPAIIELRYEDKIKFDSALKLYEGLLYNAPEEAPGDGKSVRTFRIGYSKLADHRDMLLRLTYPLGKLPTNADHTVLYWKVKGTDMGNLTTLHTTLAKTLMEVEPPAQYETSTITTGPPTRSLLQDNTSGTLVGLTINPPVPTATMPEENGIALSLFEWLKVGWSIVSLLLLPVVGVGALMLGRQQGRNNNGS